MTSASELLVPEIYFFRHGKTAWNLEGRLQGILDSELVPEAQKEAELVDMAFASTRFHWAFHSPLDRVKATIEAMPYLKQLPWEVCPELQEISFGAYGGSLRKNIPASFIQKREQDLWNTPWPEGESHQSVLDRLKGFCAQVRILQGRVAIFAHETVNRVLIGELANWSNEKTLSFKHPHNVVYRIDNDGISSKVVSEDWIHDRAFAKF